MALFIHAQLFFLHVIKTWLFFTTCPAFFACCKKQSGFILHAEKKPGVETRNEAIYHPVGTFDSMTSHETIKDVDTQISKTKTNIIAKTIR